MNRNHDLTVLPVALPSDTIEFDGVRRNDIESGQIRGDPVEEACTRSSFPLSPDAIDLPGLVERDGVNKLG
jgi:hypothetical protein